MIYLQDLADWGLLDLLFNAGAPRQREIEDVEYEEITDPDTPVLAEPQTNQNDETDTESG